MATKAELENRIIDLEEQVADIRSELDSANDEIEMRYTERIEKAIRAMEDLL